MAPQPSTAILIMLKTLCLLTFILATILFSDDTSNQPRYTKHGRRRHLLSGGLGHGLPLYLMLDDRTVGVDVDVSGTVADLYQIAADTFGKNKDGIELRFGDIALTQRDTLLADTGLSSEATITVNIVIKNDLVDLFAMFDHDEQTKQTLFSERQLAQMQKIRELNEEALRRGDYDNKIFRSINGITRSDESFAILEVDKVSIMLSQSDLARYGLTKIPRSDYIEASSRVRIVSLSRFSPTKNVHIQWSRLPPQTVILRLSFYRYGGPPKSEWYTFDLNGIQCDNLQYVHIAGMPERTRLDLTALERCHKLKKLKVTNNEHLSELKLPRGDTLPELEMVDLMWNALPPPRWKEIVAPLAGAKSLRTLVIDINVILKSRDSEQWKHYTGELKQLFGPDHDVDIS